jgi:tRNA(Ile)-lysidine synthase TilS/MesJ
MFTFIDRLGHQEHLRPNPGERVDTILNRHRIPADSVIVLKEGRPVSDFHAIESASTYEAHLIEGFDIASIRALYHDEDDNGAGDAAYVKRSLIFSLSGSFERNYVALDAAETAEYVERTIFETCTEFDLITPGESVLLGLSGGVDSGSLLLALSAMRVKLPSFRLMAVTFEDNDRDSPTFQQARDLAASVSVEHAIAPAGLAEEIFHLNAPLREILPALMTTPSAHFAMYIDHHTTRRTLEVFAERHGLTRIALGLHTTDLVAGLLNGWMTGYQIGGLPTRKIGNATYIYPLAFILKRELHLYFLHKTGRLALHAYPNAWERRPLDRNFYYYVADVLQSYWPGMEKMLLTAHNLDVTRKPPLRYEQCRNCGSVLLVQTFTPVSAGECDACTVLRRAGYIS